MNPKHKSHIITTIFLIDFIILIHILFNWDIQKIDVNGLYVYNISPVSIVLSAIILYYPLYYILKKSLKIII